jgi:hypothetical protein
MTFEELTGKITRGESPRYKKEEFLNLDLLSLPDILQT